MLCHKVPFRTFYLARAYFCLTSFAKNKFSWRFQLQSSLWCEKLFWQGTKVWFFQSHANSHSSANQDLCNIEWVISKPDKELKKRAFLVRTLQPAHDYTRAWTSLVSKSSQVGMVQTLQFSFVGLNQFLEMETP